MNEVPPEPSAEASAHRLFGLTFACTLAARLLLASSFPVVGDEAYLFNWARDLAWGYYDHPPAAAWLLHPLVRAGLDSPLFLRLPSVLLYPALALVLVRALHPFGIERAWLGGTLFLLLPLHVVGVLMLTDVALVLFVGLAGAVWFRTVASRDDSLRGYALAGALLGLALLAKYLAALLAVGIATWFVLSVRGAPAPRRRVAGFALLVACALPFVVAHLAWNSAHCWSTVAFNLVSRHAGESKNYSISRNLWVFVLAHLWALGPPVLWYVLRRWRRLVEVARTDAFRPAALGFAVPTALLGLAAATLLFGAYWILPFVFFFFLLVPRVLDVPSLKRSIVFLAVFTGLHVAVLATALSQPLDAWRGAGFHDSLVTMERTDELLAALERLEPGLAAPAAASDTHLMARGYSLAALLSYRRGAPVPVFGEGSHYGRQDDLATDFRTFDGDSVVLVSKRPVPPESFAPYFATVEHRLLSFHGTPIHVAVGRGFRFARYRRGVLAPIRDRYYDGCGRGAIGGVALPVRGCPFCERYFP